MRNTFTFQNKRRKQSRQLSLASNECPMKQSDKDAKVNDSKLSKGIKSSSDDSPLLKKPAKDMKVSNRKQIISKIY